MRAAAERRVSGPAATPVQAAGGGLEVPGREQTDSDLPTVGSEENRIHEPIPGERDATTRTRRTAGAVGGAFNGEDDVSGNVESSMAKPTRRDRVLEGGGGEAGHRFDKQGDN